MILDKKYKVSLISIFCIFLNCAGGFIARYYSLPLWLNSIGTVFSSYMLGAVCGSIIGTTSNIISSLSDPVSYFYSLTSIVIAVIVGISAKNKMFETFFGTITVSVLITISAILISVPICVIFADGKIGNIWGDGVVAFFREQHFPKTLCIVIGEFYIEFFDKFITLVLLYISIQVYRLRHKHSKNLKKYMEIKFYETLYVFLHIKDIFKSIVIFAGLSVIALCAQNAEALEASEEIGSYVQTVYSRNNGLPCGEANCIAQTNDGILWIGTYAGLYRYNGCEFRRMENYDSVHNVNCLFVDEEGRLWIGTNDNGLSICINEKIQNVIDVSTGLKSSSIRSITKSSDGFYYIGTSSGVQIITLNSGMRILNDILEIGYTSTLASGKDSNVAAINSSGRLCLINNCKFQCYEDSKENFLSCTFDDSGILYCGTRRNHIYKYEIKNNQFNRIGAIETGNLSCINGLYNNHGKIFICADNGIGYITKSGTAKQINTESFNNSIDTMLSDYQGNYWFTSSRLGLLKMSNSSFINLYNQLGMDQKVVNSIALWDDSIYVGTDAGLDVIKDGKSIRGYYTDLCKSHRIRCIKAASSNNHLWLCSYGHGLMEFEPNGLWHLYDSSIEGFGNRVRCVIELNDGTIVSADEKGLSFIKNQRLVHKVYSNKNLRSAMTLSLMEYDDHLIFAGTNGDGIAIVQDGKVERFITTKDGLTSNVILRTVREYSGDGVFVVTSNSLCYLMPAPASEEKWTVRVIKNFPYFNNFDIQPNKDGKLFVLGSAGIYVVEQKALIDDKKPMFVELLDSRSGLLDSLTANAWNCVDKDDNLYLSSGTGVYTVNMNNYQKNKISYRMMMPSIRLDGQICTCERGETFIIKRNVAKIELFPEVVNYTVQDPYVSFWLEGFDNSKTTVLQSELTGISYTNLPSNNYVFHMEVLNNHGAPIEQSQWTLYKQKEIHDNNWFKVYLFLVGMIAIAWFTWFIVKTQIQRVIEFQKKQIEFAQKQARMAKQTIFTIAKTVDARDENTSQHSMRVAQYSVMIAEELGFSKQECENLSMAALLHDIGKIGIPDRILNKAARLTEEEYEIMKSHVTRGAEILKEFSIVDHVADGVLYHHEHYDGSGYALGLKGECIPLYGRIIGAADAFDAMTANRVYRRQQKIEYVIAEFKRGRGTQFDPKIADILLKLIEDKKINIDELYSSKKE